MAAAVLVLLILALTVQLFHLFQELGNARKEEISYTARLEDLRETNRRLEEDIANQEDLELVEDIARNELGMAAPGEKIFRFSK